MQARKADIERQFEASKAQFDQAQEKIEARTGRNLILAILIGLAFGGGAAAQPARDQRAVHALRGRARGLRELRARAGAAQGGVPRAAHPDGRRRRGRRAASPTTGAPGGQLLAVLGGIVIVSAVAARGAGACPSSAAPARALVRDLAAGAFVQGYVTFLATFTVVLTAAEGGQWWTLAFIIIAVAADVGAYAFGLMFGKHKMAPVISPKKTWEGFAGGAGREPRRRRAALDLHARQHVVVRPHLRRGDLPHARRSATSSSRSSSATSASRT